MLKGTVEIPSDKSISQRALILSTLACGNFEVKNFCLSQDCLSTLNVVKALGVDIDFIDKNNLKISNKGLIKPLSKLNCNNSGTCIRIISGVLVGQNFESVLTGDESLSKRPMNRIVEPLRLMGANIQDSNGVAPIKIFPSNLHGIEYTSTVSSAQVKSCILLASLQADGKTFFKEPFKSRNHTEIMLKNMGADIFVKENTIEIEKSILIPKNTMIVGDFSSAAFLICAGLIIPKSEIILKKVGLNPTRTGFLNILKNMGADIEILDYQENEGEPYGDLKIKNSELNAVTVEGEIIANAIDELPLLALLGVCAKGKTILKDAQELRKKESDRITSIVNGFRKLGIEITEKPDGFEVEGGQKFIGNVEVDSFKDHRIAMCLYLAGMLCEKPIKIKDFDCVSISFPEFERIIKSLEA